MNGSDLVLTNGLRYPIDICHMRLAWNINQPQSLRRKTMPHYIEFTTEDNASSVCVIALWKADHSGSGLKARRR
jgi:hypothetical protein